MAIRLRKVLCFAGKREWCWRAYCAAETKEMHGDVYLDDSQHHALTGKFESDFRKMGFLKEREVEDATF